MVRNPIVTRFTKVGGGGDCTFARASPVSLCRKPLSLDIEATSKTDLSLSGSLVHRQTWRLTGKIRMLLGQSKTSKKPTFIFAFLHVLFCFVPFLHATACKSGWKSLAKTRAACCFNPHQKVRDHYVRCEMNGSTQQ